MRAILGGLAAIAIIVGGCDSSHTTKKETSVEKKGPSGETIQKTETKTTETKPK